MNNLNNHLENEKRGVSSSRKISREEEVINNLEKVFGETIKYQYKMIK